MDKKEFIEMFRLSLLEKIALDRESSIREWESHVEEWSDEELRGDDGSRPGSGAASPARARTPQGSITACFQRNLVSSPQHTTVVKDERSARLRAEEDADALKRFSPVRVHRESALVEEDIDEIYRIVSRDDPERLTRQLVFEAMTAGRGARAVARVVRNNPKLDALMAPTTLFTAFEAVDVNTHKREETRVAIAAAESAISQQAEQLTGALESLLAANESGNAEGGNPETGQAGDAAGAAPAGDGEGEGQGQPPTAAGDAGVGPPAPPSQAPDHHHLPVREVRLRTTIRHRRSLPQKLPKGSNWLRHLMNLIAWPTPQVSSLDNQSQANLSELRRVSIHWLRQRRLNSRPLLLHVLRLNNRQRSRSPRGRSRKAIRH